MKTILSSALAIMLVGLSVAPVAADPAYLAVNANVRSGPSLKSAVTDILLRGDLVEVDRCDDGWCFIRYDSYGYVAEVLLQPAHKTQRYGFHRNALPYMQQWSPWELHHGPDDRDMPRLYGHDAYEYGAVR